MIGYAPEKMNGYQLVIRSKDGRNTGEQGTAWFLRPGLVVTAFHVVGNKGLKEWFTARDSETLWLTGFPNHQEIRLDPACFDAAIDVALLRPAKPVDDINTLTFARALSRDARWWADGFPGFARGKAWALTGRISAHRGDQLQLFIDQSTDVPWGGVSGSAVCIDARVAAGIITDEEPRANTLWATSFKGIARLVAKYDAVQEVAELLRQSGIVWNGDIPDLRKQISNLEEIPARIATLHTTLDGLEHPAPEWTIPENILKNLRNQWGIDLVAQSAKPVPHDRPDDDEFERLITRIHPPDRFGGRSDQLRRVTSILDNSAGGYVFVTGPAGLGKSAFLSKCIRTLRASGENPAVHYISRHIDGGLSASFLFRNLSEQLMRVHDLGGELPTDVRRLRQLYVDLLKVPAAPGQRVVVFIDGLDEALGDWTPDSTMFPPPASGIHVVFSARALADRDWLHDLGLKDLGHDRILRLERLNREEVEALLRVSKLVDPDSQTFPALVETFVDKTGGDPDYVTDALDLLEKHAGDAAALQDLPTDHSQYLRDWWDEEYAKHDGGQAFEDLMGVLAVLRAPLGAEALAELDDTDHIRHANIGSLVKAVARYVEGDRKSGYRLARSRMIDLVKQKLPDRMDEIRGNLANLSKRWNDPKLSKPTRAYTIRFGIAHLLDTGKFKDAIALFSPDWLAAKWQADGSYIGLLDDLALLVGSAAAEATMEEIEDAAGGRALKFELGDLEKLSLLPALAISEQTARELIADLPIPVLRAELRLGKGDQVLKSLDRLSNYRGRAAQQLVAVSEELLTSRPDIAGNLEATVAGLVGRALGMLHLVRTSQWKMERFDAIADILSRWPLGDRDMVQLVDQARTFAESCDEDGLRACALARVAVLAGAAPGTRPQAEKFLQLAEQAAESLQEAGDRILFWSCALPALRQVQPQRVPDLVRSLLEGVERQSTSPLNPYPLGHFLGNWEPLRHGEASWALPLLLELADKFSSGTEKEPYLPDPLLPLIFKLGGHQQAKVLLDRITAGNATAGASLTLTVAHHLAEHDRPSVLNWLGQIQPPSDKGLASALGALGEWDRALRVLAGIPPGERKNSLSTSLNQVASAPMKEEERISTVIRLMELSEDLETEARATLEGEAAYNLVTVNEELAREFLKRSVQRTLSNLPEGSADELYHVWAVLLAENGHYSEATQLAGKCKWKHQGILTCVDIITATPPHEVEAFKETAEAILELTRVDSTLGGDQLCAACDGAAALPAALAPEATAICETVIDRIGYLRDAGEIARCALAEVQASMKIDPSRGSARLASLMAWVRRIGIDEIRADNWSRICKFLGGLAASDQNARSQLQAAAKLPERAADPRNHASYKASYAAALAAIDLPQSIDMLEQLTTEVEKLRVDKPEGAALAFIYMVAQLTGGPIVTVAPWTATLSALSTVAPRAPERLRPCMERVIDSFFRLNLEPRDLKSGVTGMVEAAARLPGKGSDILYETVDGILERFSKLVEIDDFTDVVHDSLQLLSRDGHPDSARRLLYRLPKGQPRLNVENTIQFQSSRDAVKQTPFETAFFRTRKGIWTAEQINIFGLEGAAALLVRVFANEGHRVTRERLLSEFAPALTFVLKNKWHLEGVSSLVKSVLQFDEHFTKAAEVIARQT